MPPQELESAWNAIREELRRDVTDLTFHLWLDPLELAGREADLLFIRAPRHIRALVAERYLPLLRTAAGRALSTPVVVQVVGEEWSPAAGERGSPEQPSSSEEPLNPKYTFDQFVIGGANRLAHAAALAVAEQPGQAYNPLFLHGPPGLGKTHLLHAIGNYVRRYGDGVIVRYATSEDFTSGFVSAVRGEGGIGAFKSAFRGVDVLLVDDVQFLADRVRTQEEFFHTFNALYEAGCQLVVSSDRRPGEMGAIQRRLAERFGSGLVAELEPPELDVRLAILRKRVALDAVQELDEDTLREVATCATSSVRALEGALIRVVAYASLRCEPASPQLAREILGRLHPSRTARQPSIGDVQEATAEAFGMAREALIAHDRQPAATFARQVAMYLARELTDASLPAIGADFGGRNHSTVLHAHRRIASQVREGALDTARAVDRVRSTLSSPLPDRAE